MLKTDEAVVALSDHPVVDAPVLATTPNGSFTFGVERIDHEGAGPILRLYEVARGSRPTSEVEALQRQLEAARQENIVLRTEIRFHKAAGEAFDSIVEDRDGWKREHQQLLVRVRAAEKAMLERRDSPLLRDVMSPQRAGERLGLEAAAGILRRAIEKGD